MATLLDRIRALGPAERARIVDANPLSSMQERLWFLDQLVPGRPRYKGTSAVRLIGDLDVRALECAVAGIVRRHDVLRTTFPVIDGRPMQLVDPGDAFRLRVVDLTGGDRPLAQAERLASEEAQRSCDLVSGPLLRVRLLRLAPDDHLFVLSMHHIVSDRWSAAIFVRELCDIYRACVERRPAELPRLDIQYQDYALWQRDWLAGAEATRQTAWWTSTLKGALAVLPLPYDRPRPPIQDARGARRRRPIPAAAAGAVRRTAKRRGCTASNVWLAALYAILTRYAGTTDACVGVPVSLRTRRETEPLIGPFLNTVVVRVRCEPSLLFTDLLERVRRVTVDALDHRELPFEKVVEAVGADRTMAYNPLFQVLFSYQAGLAEPFELPGVTASSIEVERGTSIVDLTVAIDEDAGGSACELMAEYDSALFDASTIDGLLDDYFTVIAEAGHERPLRIGDLLSSSTSRLSIRHGHRRGAPAEGIQQAIARHANDRPDAVCAVCGDAHVTFAEFDRRVDRLARRLRRLGAGPGDVIAVCIDRSLDLLVALNGVMRAGAAYLPLDPGSPGARLAYLLEHARPALLLVGAERPAAVDGYRGAVLSLEPDASGDEPPAPWPANRPEDAAYVIYTSGSTREPKGTVVSHRALLNVLASFRDLLVFTEHDCFLASTTVSFDIAALEIFVPLLCGGRVHVAGRTTHANPVALRRTIADAQPTVIQATPSGWRMLAESGWPGAPGVRALCGGEALTPSLAAALSSRCGAVWNVYGPTETTVWSSCSPVDAHARISLGAPIANTSLYAVGPGLVPAPLGVAGEICIGGDGLADGYLRNAALTADRFVPDPFSATPGARMYRTGDLGTFRRDGAIEFLGRRDFQVKIRGHRVEPDEIAAWLDDHPDLAEAVVVVPGDAASPELAAYYTSRSGALGPDELRGWLATRLPGFMVPRWFVPLTEMPRTPNGKIDRRRLPAPAVSSAPRLDGRRADTRHAGEIAEAVAGIWAAVLGIDAPGGDDQFFDRGGHSLLAIQLMARVHQRLGVEVPLQQFFANPTLDALIAWVEQSRPAARRLPALIAASATRVVPLSFAQQRLWFLQQLDPSSIAYNSPYCVRLEGRLDVAALSRAVTRLITRHDVLGRTFPIVDDVVQQQPLDRVPSSAMIDLTGMPEARRSGDARRAIETLARTPFHLDREAPIRVAVIALSERVHWFCAIVHHIVFDGASSEIFFRDLSELYDAEASSRAAALCQLPIQFADFAVWQRSWLTDDVIAEQLAYWRDVLAGYRSHSPLPGDGALEHSHASRWTEEASAGALETLRTLCRARDVTLHTGLFLCYAVLLQAIGHQADLVIGTNVTGRRWVETEGLIGTFANLLPVRVSLADDADVCVLLERAGHALVGAQMRQDVPFDAIVADQQRERPRTTGPLVQTIFSTVHERALDGLFPGLAVESIPIDTRAAKFDLTVTASIADRRLSFVAEYGTGRFDAATIERALKLLTHVVDIVGRHPEWRLSDLRNSIHDADARLTAARRHDARRAATASLRRRFATVPRPMAAGS